MVGTIQSGVANVYQNAQNISAGNGFQNQGNNVQQQQEAQRTQETEEQNRNNFDQANLATQRNAENETVGNAGTTTAAGPGSLVDISV